MADPAAEWIANSEASWPKFVACRDLAVAALDGASMHQEQPSPTHFTLVEANVILAGQPHLRLPRQAVTLPLPVIGESTDSNEQLRRYLECIASIREDQRPGRIKRRAVRQIELDGELARLEVLAYEDKKTRAEDSDWEFLITLCRTLGVEARGSQFVRQILQGRCYGDLAPLNNSLYSTAELYEGSLRASRGQRQHRRPSANWQEVITQRFRPAVPMGALAVETWKELITSPLCTTHVLRNRGNASVVPSSAQTRYRWATEQDAGTEAGEMTVQDVLDIVWHEVEGAKRFEPEASPDHFTLTDAEIIMADSPDQVKVTHLWEAPRLFIGGSPASLTQVSQRYAELAEREAKGERISRWRTEARKTMCTDAGMAQVTIMARRAIDDSGNEEQSASIHFWRTIGKSGLAVEHVLEVSITHYQRKPVVRFENKHVFWQPSREDMGLVKVARLPAGLERLRRAHPQIDAELTYDKWWELLRRSLDENDIITA